MSNSSRSYSNPNSLYSKSNVTTIAGSGATHSIIPEAPKDGKASECQIWKIVCMTLDDKRNILYIGEQTKIFRTLEISGKNRMLTLTNSPPLLGIVEKGASGLCYDAAFDTLYLANGVDAGRRITKDDAEGDFAIRPCKSWKYPGTQTNFVAHRFTTDAQGNFFAIPKADIKIIAFTIDRQEYRVIEADSVFTLLAKAHNIVFEDIKYDIVRNCIFALAGSAVWRVDLNGNVTLYAGSLEPGYADGPLLQARFGMDPNSKLGPQYMCIDDYGRMYISDHNNCCIRVIDEHGSVNTIGKPYQFDPKVKNPWKDGSGATAVFTHWISDLCVTPEGTNLYVADNLANRIRCVALPKVTMDFARPRRESILSGGQFNEDLFTPSARQQVMRIRRGKSTDTMSASQIAINAEADDSDCIIA